MVRWRFDGWIAGVGTTSGTRLVLGHWPRSPLGSFSDVMIAHADGRRELLAPTAEIGDFVAATYRFDDVGEVPVQVHRGRTDGALARWQVRAGALRWSFTVGERDPLGALLRFLPAALATSRTMARITDPIASVAFPGVRTYGTAAPGRTEWYAARDLYRITATTARLDGSDLGSLSDVTPAPEFGFSGTPTTPMLTRVISTVEQVGTPAPPDTDSRG